MSDSTITRRSKETYYPVRIVVRISQRQADDLKTVKEKMALKDSDIVREALQMWLNETLYNIRKAA